ncbi:hypothetical protein DET50_103219 [Marinobacter pelagius]|uniref:Winged helix DNA-binding domain-containing protein n=2 Tax=Marinobacter pelagius TaxID=379482 RepID=A0A366GZ68_9GAMM|nr:hypothetical protein DET50_103219 [Marinobacter pelagius]
MDRRNKRVQLTDKGQRFFAELAEIMTEAIDLNESNKF